MPIIHGYKKEIAIVFFLMIRIVGIIKDQWAITLIFDKMISPFMKSGRVIEEIVVKNLWNCFSVLADIGEWRNVKPPLVMVIVNIFICKRSPFLFYLLSFFCVNHNS